MLEYLGSSLALCPVDDINGNVRYVTGLEKMAQDILMLLLIGPGELGAGILPAPDFGLAPDLFEAMSNDIPQYWAYGIQEYLRKWVVGLGQVQVTFGDEPDATGELSVEIIFSARNAPGVDSLTFGWYAYRGAIFDGDADQFRQSMALNGQQIFPTL